MSDTVDVVLAHHWADHRECCPGGRIQEGCDRGVHREPTDGLALEESFARQLVDAGVANWATEEDALLAGGDRRRVAPPVDADEIPAHSRSREQLIALAESLGIEVKKTWNRKQIASAIVEHQKVVEAQETSAGDGEAPEQ